MANNCLVTGTFDLNELIPDKKEDINFIPFSSVPTEGVEDLDSWLQCTRNIEDDLHYLLAMPLKKFWCQVIFDDSLHDCISSFLKHAPLMYFPLNENKYSKQVVRRLNILGHLFFLTCLRMSTYKEDKNQVIPIKEFGDILYDNLLFDIPRLLNFCALYADANRNLVEQIVKNIFTVQPKYHEDVKAVAETIPTILDSMCEKFNLEKHPLDYHAPKRISREQSTRNSDPQGFLVDVITSAYDIFNSLKAFFEIYNPAVRPFHSQNVLIHVSEFYDVFCNRLFEEFEKTDASAELSEAFCLTRYTILQAFRLILNCSTLMRIFENVKHPEEIVDAYTETLQLVLDASRFSADYFHFFPLEEDVELIEQTGFRFDEVSLGAIKDSIARAMELNQPTIPDIAENGPAEASGSRDGGDDEYLGACAAASSSSIVDDDEVLMKIASIQELLPHLGAGFVRKCLEMFDGSVEAAMNAIFEGNLPPSLLGVEQDLDLESSEAEEESDYGEDPPECSEPVKRRNVFDDDFGNGPALGIDFSKIHLGKKGEKISLEVDDIKLKEKIKLLVDNDDDDEEEKGARERDLYQDEYDDTYDDHNLGKVDVDSVDELTSKNHFVVERLNAPLHRAESEDESGEDDEPARNPASFLEDPAVLRERAAERRQRMQAGQAGHRGGRGFGRGFGNYGQNRGGGGRGGEGRGGGGGGRGGFAFQGAFGFGQDNRERNKTNKTNHHRRDLAAKKHRI